VSSPTRAVYVISVAATLVGTHPQTLRTYERLGFLSPSRSKGGARLYSDDDLVILARVVELSSSGVSLPGIAQILSLEARVRRLEADLESARSALRQHKAQFHKSRKSS
jgi:MerR family transcriptional regulator/heat shock protein HspR